MFTIFVCLFVCIFLFVSGVLVDEQARDFKDFKYQLCTICINTCHVSLLLLTCTHVYHVARCALTFLAAIVHYTHVNCALYKYQHIPLHIIISCSFVYWRGKGKGVLCVNVSVAVQRRNTAYGMCVRSGLLVCVCVYACISVINLLFNYYYYLLVYCCVLITLVDTELQFINLFLLL